MLDWMGLSFENGVLRIMDHEFTWGRLADLLAYQPDAPMLFSSGLFFFLFIGFSVFYYLLRKKMMARIIYVTLFSLYFSSPFISITRAAASGLACWSSRPLPISSSGITWPRPPRFVPARLW